MYREISSLLFLLGVMVAMAKHNYGYGQGYTRKYEDNHRQHKRNYYINCRDALAKGETKSGVYTLKPDSLPAFQAYCDMETDGGGWTVLQRRMDGSVDFFLDWASYEYGFGNLSGEYWLGLSKIHRLANYKARQELRVDLEDFEGNKAYANYCSFYIGGSSTKYTLHVTGYCGTAGDSLKFHDGKKFSTKDNDNGAFVIDCANAFQGAWWYGSCHFVHLNGKYDIGGQVRPTGVIWTDWQNIFYLCKYVDMKIRDQF